MLNKYVNEYKITPKIYCTDWNFDDSGIAYIEHTIIADPIRADARQYVIYGYNLLNYKFFSSQQTEDAPVPDSFRSPGYPLMIALSFYLGGNRGFYPIMLLWQALLGALMVPLTFLIAIRLMPLAWALIAALLVCFNPHLISMASYILTETLFGTIFLIAALLLWSALIRNRTVLFALSGCAFGVTYLVNETIMLLPFGMGTLLWMVSKNRSRLKVEGLSRYQIVIFLAFFTCFPLGWSIRNHVNLPDDAMKGSNRAISTLSHGAYPEFMYKSPAYKYFPYREDPEQPEFSSSLGNFTSILWKRVKERPLRFLSWYLLEKPYYLWSWNILQGQGDVYVYPVKTSLYLSSAAADTTRVIIKILHPFILAAALIGAVLFFKVSVRTDVGRSNRAIALLLLSILIYYTLLYTVFAPWPRYSVPLRPFLYVWSLWSIRTIYSVFINKGLHAYERDRNASGAV